MILDETLKPHAEIHVEFERNFYKELRKILFKYGLSVSHFFSYIIQLTVTGDERITEILNEAKKITTVKNAKQEIVNTDSETLFNLIEESSPFMKG